MLVIVKTFCLVNYQILFYAYLCLRKDFIHETIKALGNLLFYFFSSFLSGLKVKFLPGMVVHLYNPNTLETEARELGYIAS
jgi:hypothetical protein